MIRDKYSRKRDFFYNLSPWILAAACVLLFFVLTLFAVNNYQREKKLMVEALIQKGGTIIRFISSSSRESMRANFRGSQTPLPWEEHVKIAMEQAVEQPGVDYVVLVGLHDRVIAGAGEGGFEKNLTASTRSFLSSLKTHDARVFISRDIKDEKGRKRYFQVAAPFKPVGVPGRFPGMGGRSGMNQRMMHNLGHQSMFEGFKREMDRLGRMQPILIVQLNSEQFSYPIRRQILQMVILLLVFGLVAVGGLLSLLTLRGLKGSRLRLGKIEKELQRSERLAALGKVAAGVAHELRNPLSSIKGLALLLKSKSSDEGSSVETADILVQEVERLNRSIEELLDYAKPAKLNKINLNINVVVEKTIQLVAMDIQAQGISLDSHLAEGLPEIMVDEDKLNQVFLNLFLNGIQAMANGGILTVSSIRRGDTIAVVIEDTGSGVAESNLARVFDPYFTTKNDGTGLGLAMSSKIVEEHEGKIILTSEPGKGTRVEVILPAVSG